MLKGRSRFSPICPLEKCKTSSPSGYVVWVVCVAAQQQICRDTESAPPPLLGCLRYGQNTPVETYHSPIRRDLLDVTVEESDSDRLSICTRFFSGSIWKQYNMAPILINLFYLQKKKNQDSQYVKFPETTRQKYP